jgi:hypothetical protein
MPDPSLVALPVVRAQPSLLGRPNPNIAAGSGSMFCCSGRVGEGDSGSVSTLCKVSCAASAYNPRADHSCCERGHVRSRREAAKGRRSTRLRWRASIAAEGHETTSIAQQAASAGADSRHSTSVIRAARHQVARASGGHSPATIRVSYCDVWSGSTEVRDHLQICQRHGHYAEFRISQARHRPAAHSRS